MKLGELLDVINVTPEDSTTFAVQGGARILIRSKDESENQFVEASTRSTVFSTWRSSDVYRIIPPDILYNTTMIVVELEEWVRGFE